MSGRPAGQPGRTLPRVVSLVPSATETLLALDANVVACTKFCNQPQLATVGGTKNPDVAAIEALRPDCVVVDTEENRRQDADRLRAAGLRVVVTSVRSMEDAHAVVGQLASASGTTARSRELSAGDAPGNEPMATSPRRLGFVPIWRRPWMTVNGATYGAAMLRSIGIDLVTADHDTEYPTVDLADIASLAPELVLVPSEPYSFTSTHVAELVGALREATVVRVDGEDLFWWGMRTPAARCRLGAQLGAGSGDA